MLDAETRYQLLKLLAAEPDLTQRAMAKKLGFSLGKMNFCLSQLIKKGFVEMRRVGSCGDKSKIHYLITPHGLEEKAAAAVRFLKRKLREYEEIKKQIDELYRDLKQDGIGCPAGKNGIKKKINPVDTF